MSYLTKPEVLAPAGDHGRLEAAVRFGADAVYLGGKELTMRASPANFEPEALEKAVSFCHGNKVKVYLAMNTILTNSQADVLPEFVKTAADAGVDAFIVADIGALMQVKRLAPEISVHISTQAGVVNYLTATELYKLGAGRVILARELPLSEIARIRENTPPELELEAFVHGAMCMSFSGRCLISQYLTDRDANRGECTQPCRWSYHLMEEKREGRYFPVFEDSEGSYILNAMDLCMLAHIDLLAKAGVCSFKIEGRAKSAYYVAAITNAYRMAVDLYAKNPDGYRVPDWLMGEVMKVSHREYSTGFYFEGTPPGQCYENGGYVRKWEVVAVVEDWRDNFLILTERNRFSRGDMLELLIPGQKPVTLIADVLTDGDGNEIETARHPMMRLKIACDTPYPAGSMLRRSVRETGTS